MRIPLRLRLVYRPLCSLLVLIAATAAAYKLLSGTSSVRLACKSMLSSDSHPEPKYGACDASDCVAVSSFPEGVSAFVQSLGIGTHLSYPATPYYGQPQSVISALQYLGMNTIRDQPPGYTNDPITTVADNMIAGAGVRFDVLIL